jgi:hypothetical protein
VDDDFDRHLVAGRQRWPEMALQEVEAGNRLDYALATGDIDAGVRALTDWIDARIAMAVYASIRPDDPPPR